MSHEEAIWIDGPNGQLSAIVHYPTQEIHLSACIIMLNAGQLNRVGPQRLYVNAARKWAQHGFMVMRLDLSGVGDSQGQNDAVHFDGHLPEDVAAAVGYASNELKADAIYLQGLCAGARVAIKHAAVDERVDGVLAWSCPVIGSAPGSPSSPYESASGMSSWNARDTISNFLCVFTELRFTRLSWWRTRRRHDFSELSALFRSVWRILRGERPSGNPFLDAADEILRSGRSILFVFGEKDRMPLGEFRDRFVGVVESTSSPQCFHVVAHGTHTFNAVDSQSEVIASSLRWVERCLLVQRERDGDCVS